MDNREDRRGGFYWKDGKPYVSVTNILKVIDKPALRYWFGKEVYYAMVKDPTLEEQAALSAPYKTSDKAKSRGTTVHSIVEAFKTTGEYIESIPSEYKGYAEAFYKWTQDNHVTVIEQEKTVTSTAHRYAGTLDLLVKLNGNTKIMIVDIKTGKDIYPESHLQNSAYFEALKEQRDDVEGIATLLLRDNGKYKFEQGTIEFDIFLAAKKLWEWQNLDKCISVGYLEDVNKLKLL